TLAAQGRSDEAVVIFKQAINREPTNPERYRLLGDFLKDQGQLDEAIAAYKQAIVQDQKSAQLYLLLGIALRARSGPIDATEAIAPYKKASDLDTKDPWPHINIGNILKSQGRLEEAISEFRWAVKLYPHPDELQPQPALPHLYLGEALLEKG